MEGGFAAERQEMVDKQLRRRGINDPLVLRAMAEVPRHRFVPERMERFAYQDSPLEIGEGQTISQPFIVALMTQAALCSSGSIVLDVGTGSGYAAAVFSLIVKKVFTIERIPFLAHEAEKRFKELGYTNIETVVGDGTLGWPEKAPFDAIVVTAAAPETPPPLLSQLAIGGTLVIPVGDLHSQRLVRYSRQSDEEYGREFLEYVRFVPLIGEEGWR